MRLVRHAEPMRPRTTAQHASATMAVKRRLTKVRVGSQRLATASPAGTAPRTFQSCTADAWK
eukprot:12696471-Alexandrium_andersonii.AAC.1